MHDIPITGDMIRLGQLLKLAGAVDNGADVRPMLEDGLVTVNEEVERSWEILDPVIEHWASLPVGPDPYPAGSWGPASAEALLARTGRTWRRP